MEKKCENHCPNCGAGSDKIDWGRVESDSPIYQRAICDVCGCEFSEVQTYSHTEFELDAGNRVHCPHPLSLFYDFMDEVPNNTRVSNNTDCQKCSEDCDSRYCLITEIDPAEALAGAIEAFLKNWDAGAYGLKDSVEALRKQKTLIVKKKENT